MSSAERVPLPSRDPLLDAARLKDPAYFAATLERYARAPALWPWYLRPHSHTCPRCKEIVTHTGLEATRDGAAAHECCGHDVRLPL